MRVALLTTLQLFALVLTHTWSGASQPEVGGCPGISRGVCGRSCRLHVCGALTALSNSTQGPGGSQTQKADLVARVCNDLDTLMIQLHGNAC